MDTITKAIQERKEIKEVTPLELALVINENEDLIRVGATIYPLTVHIKSMPPDVCRDMYTRFPYVPFQQEFTSDMFLTAIDTVYLVDPMALYMTKVGLLCKWDPESHTKVPIRRIHNRRICA